MHEQVKRLLSKYHNGTCTEEERLLVQAHLRECDECKKILMEMKFAISYEVAADGDEDDEDRKHKEAIVNAENKDVAVRKGGKFTRGCTNVLKNGKVTSDEANGVKSGKVTSDGANGVKSEKNVLVTGMVAVIGIVVLLLAFVMANMENENFNETTVISHTKEYVEFVYDSYRIPSNYEKYSSEELWGHMYYYKQDLKEKLSGYYMEENEDFEKVFTRIEAMLDVQMNGSLSRELVKYEDLEMEVNLDRVDSKGAEVTVNIGRIVWKIHYVWNGDELLIKSLEDEG